MQDLKVWNMLSRHLAQEESPAEKELVITWLNQSKENRELYLKIKNIWDGNSEHNIRPRTPLTFAQKFTKQKIKNFIINQALGNLVGFIVGMWVTAMFSHYVLERRGLKNLFGLAGRKKVVVNEIPEWLQGAISILVGFIALELINHFFQTKKHLIVWAQTKRIYDKLFIRFFKNA